MNPCKSGSERNENEGGLHTLQNSRSRVYWPVLLTVIGPSFDVVLESVFRIFFLVVAYVVVKESIWSWLCLFLNVVGEQESFVCLFYFKSMGNLTLYLFFLLQKSDPLRDFCYNIIIPIFCFCFCYFFPFFFVFVLFFFVIIIFSFIFCHAFWRLLLVSFRPFLCLNHFLSSCYYYSSLCYSSIFIPDYVFGNRLLFKLPITSKQQHLKENKQQQKK